MERNPLDVWDTAGRPRPALSQIQRINIFDFDNTLFKTPLPNPSLFYGKTVAMLQSSSGIHLGGWWADPRFLLATGEGFEKEQRRAWEGWWNENVVDLVRLASEDPSSLNILLTGRKMTKFVISITAMVTAKKLPFHAIVLRKGDAENTLAFKIEVMKDLLSYYSSCQEITVYDDRPSQANGFRRFFKQFQTEHRNSLLYDVVDCLEETRYLDPLLERDLVIGVLEAHNEAVQKRYLSSYVSNGTLNLKRVFFNLSYKVDPHCTKKLLEILVAHVVKEDKVAAEVVAATSEESGGSSGDDEPSKIEDYFDYHCDSMIITRRDDKQVLEQVQGVGHRDTWKVLQIGHVAGKVWALRLAPETLEAAATCVTEKMPPELLIATSKDAKSADSLKIDNWKVVHSELPELQEMRVFTTVKEQVLYRIEPVNPKQKKAASAGRVKKSRQAKKDKSAFLGSYY